MKIVTTTMKNRRSIAHVTHQEYTAWRKPALKRQFSCVKSTSRLSTGKPYSNEARRHRRRSSSFSRMICVNLVPPLNSLLFWYVEKNWVHSVLQSLTELLVSSCICLVYIFGSIGICQLDARTH